MSFFRPMLQAFCPDMEDWETFPPILVLLGFLQLKATLCYNEEEE